MRYAAKIDVNKVQVVSALRAAGAYVYDLKLPVDLLVEYQGRCYLMEIKANEKKKLTKLQLDFFAHWGADNLFRVNSPEDALRVIGAVK